MAKFKIGDLVYFMYEGKPGKIPDKITKLTHDGYNVSWYQDNGEYLQHYGGSYFDNELYSPIPEINEQKLKKALGL